ncbi:N-acetylmuramidase domain-containing protein [Pseudomonas sp. C9]|jgi:hypothetical protein|uniref:N-acetylmuramidase domain-containing protein n=1 Tax=Pseudomonas sp. C9 TaxID=1311337 RepID=UPI0009850B00|nr:N-acetylmuramidase domain-containing protein [Pseudomonas sp. C9]OOG14520.1 hypothetical protein BMS17_21240 [Pseudomonas sp. C9]
MNFKSKGRPLSDGGIERICDALSVFEPEIWAILSVESQGFGFLQDRRPKIFFERHIFHRLTGGEHDTGDSDISNQNPGGYIGGPSGYRRLEKAMELEPGAALQSTSWGIGQVMGFNFKSVGFATVNDMVAAMVKDEDAQLLAVENFIKENNLAGELQRKNWAAFTRGYNVQHDKNEYDTRLAAAYAKYKVVHPDLALRTAQAALLYLGIDPGPIDGLRGRCTTSAVKQFQNQAELPETGELDRDTESKLLEKAFPA